MDAFTVYARLTLDQKEFDKDLAGTKTKLNSLGSKAAGVAKSAIKMSKMAGIAGGIAVTKTVKDSVAAYGEYEQLVGGINTLYGENSEASQLMMKNAEQAWKTAGMTANEYYNTAMTSSAAMLKAVDGDTTRAAELTNQSIIDMSDNVNKMGTTMEAVQNAYRGFSRGNFTMLDNLSLGYSGTKQGMEELLKDAEAISGVKYDISSYADIVDALHVVQENMGITGTTAKEAEGTITGSMGGLKAAFENLKRGFSDKDADMDQLFGNVLTSAKGVFNNLLPIVKTAIGNVIRFVIKEAPNIIISLVKGIGSMLPELIKAGGELLTSIADGMGGEDESLLDVILQVIDGLINSIMENLPAFVEAGFTILEKLILGIIEKLPDLITTAADIVVTIIEGLAENFPQILEKGKEVILKIIEGITQNLPQIIEAIVSVIDTLLTTITENLPQILEAGIEILLELIQGLMDALPELIAAVPKIISTLIDNLLSLDNLGKILEAGVSIIGSLAEGILEFVINAPGYALDIITSLVDGLEELLDKALGVGKEIMESIWDGLKSIVGDLLQWAKELGQKILDAINPFKNFDAGGAVAKLDSAVKASGGDTALIDSYKKKYKIHSPSKVFHDEVGYWMGAGITEGIEDGMADGWNKNLANADIGDIGLNYKPRNTIANTSVEQFGEMMNNQKTVIPVYIGQDRIDEIVVEANKRVNYATGGR